MGGYAWTEQDDDMLEKYWGEMSIPAIAKKLNRTQNAIKTRATRLNLGHRKDNFNGFTLTRMSKILGTTFKTLLIWGEKYNFPVRKSQQTCGIYMVRTHQFWEWAKEHPDMLDFSKIDYAYLGSQPDWVQEKRKKDEKKRLRYKNKKTRWSEEEDKLLISLCKSCKYTYPEIARRLFRSQPAVKSRIKRLEIKYRPVPIDYDYPEDVHRIRPKRDWTDTEVKALTAMLENGTFTIVDISRELDRNASSIKAKIGHLKLPKPMPYAMYTDEQNDKLIKMFFAGELLEDIADELNRTEQAIRGRLREMGYTFSNKKELLKELAM